MNARAVIILHGNSNSATGALSESARLRCRTAADLQARVGGIVVPTGAFGDHFNRTGTAHWVYLAEELVRLGVPPADILGGADASNTCEDVLVAGLAQEWLRLQGTRAVPLHAVSSDFHLERVRWLYAAAGQAMPVLVAAPNPSDPEVCRPLARHEAERLAWLKAQEDPFGIPRREMAKRELRFRWFSGSTRAGADARSARDRG